MPVSQECGFPPLRTVYSDDGAGVCVTGFGPMSPPDIPRGTSGSEFVRLSPPDIPRGTPVMYFL